MKFGQLIKYNTRRIFREKSYKKCSGESYLTHFSKKSKLSTSLNQQFKVLYNFFLFYVKVEGYRNLLKLRSRPLALTSYEVFSKN